MAFIHALNALNGDIFKWRIPELVLNYDTNAVFIVEW
jgi:hypothetical protein